MSKGNLFVISGPSGVGKSTVLARVMATRKDLLFSVSATTRQPRPGEQKDIDYYFVTEADFKAMIDRGEMLEYDYHNAHYYGTPLGQLKDKLTRANVVLDVEPVGAFNVRKVLPEATLIFIMPPSVEKLERRLAGRGDTSPEQMRLRLERANWEMEQRGQYDFVVVNDEVDQCADEILKIIAAQANEE